MDKHITILGALYIANGILGLILSTLVFMGFMIPSFFAEEGAGAFALIAIVLGSICFILSIPSIIAGYGLLKRRGWARTFGIVLGALNLLDFPFGTALGIYALWVLVQEESKQFFTPQLRAIS